MNIRTSLFAPALALAALAACTDDDNPGAQYLREPQVSIVSNNLTFTASASSAGRIAFSAPGAVSVSTGASWVSAELAGDTVRVSVTENTGLYGRSSWVGLSYGVDTVRAVVQQQGISYSFGGGSKTLLLNDSRQELSVAVSSEGAALQARSTVEWATARLDREALHIALGENSSGQIRNGTIHFEVGPYADSIVVWQGEVKDIPTISLYNDQAHEVTFRVAPVSALSVSTSGVAGLTATYGDDGLTVSLPANTAGVTRQGVVACQDGDSQSGFYLLQGEPRDVGGRSYVLSDSLQDAWMPISPSAEGAELTVTTDVAWLTPTWTRAQGVTLAVGENATSHVRQAQVYISEGARTDTVSIRQGELKDLAGHNYYLAGYDLSGRQAGATVESTFSVMLATISLGGDDTPMLNLPQYGFSVPMEFDASSLSLAFVGGQNAGTLTLRNGVTLQMYTAVIDWDLMNNFASDAASAKYPALFASDNIVYWSTWQEAALAGGTQTGNMGIFDSGAQSNLAWMNRWFSTPITSFSTNTIGYFAFTQPMQQWTALGALSQNMANYVAPLFVLYNPYLLQMETASVAAAGLKSLPNLLAAPGVRPARLPSLPIRVRNLQIE